MKTFFLIDKTVDFKYNLLRVEWPIYKARILITILIQIIDLEPAFYLE